MTFESDLQTVLGPFTEVSNQLQLSRAAAPGQRRLWNESEVEREEKPHDGKRPGEFAPKGKPKTPAGQNLLFDSGVRDQPVAKPAPQPSTLEKIADEQKKSKRTPIEGQGDLFLHSPAVESWAAKRFPNPDYAASFLRWFGDSKAVGEDGTPLTLYHGTRGSFDQFTPSKSSGTASYFTVNPNVAHSYAVKYGASEMDSEFDTLRDKLTSSGVSKWDVHKRPEWKSLESAARVEGASIIPVHLAIRNPYVLDGVTDSDEVNAIKDDASEISRLRSMGYDGILVKNALDRPNIAYNKDDADSASERSDLWVTFSPNQIKSATGNSGGFAGDDQRISFSRALDEITPVEFSVAAPPRKRRVIDDKRTREDVEEDEKIFGKKKRIPTDGDKPETGWTKVGGSTVHVDDDGVIDKGCPGLKGEAVEDLIDESDESRERREARQAYARAAGITGDQITAAQAKAMGSEAHVEGMKHAKAAAEADPRPTIGTSDVLRGVDDQTGEPAGNGHELLQSNNREHPESNEQFEGTGMPSPMKFMPDEDEGTRPQWMGPKLSEMVPIPPPPKFLRDRQPIDHDEAATYKPKIAQLEADIEHWRNARDAMKKGNDISQFNLTPEQKSLAFADAKIKELKKPLDQLKRKLSDYTMRSTPNQNPKTQTWTSMDSAAQVAEAKFGIPIHHITAAMPDAYLFRLAQSIEHEALKKAARDKTKLDAGDISRIGNQYKDWSTVPRFDEASREFASENPNAGFDPYAHDTPERVWNLIHEGATVLPPKDSPEIAELAAQMISGDYNRTLAEFASDDDEKPIDDWGQEERGDTSFDPNSFSRSILDVGPVEMSRESELDTIAERMGVDVDSLRAAIAAMPGPKSESLIWIRKLMHDPSRGVLRDRNGHVVGVLTRNGQKIQLRDSRGRQSGTVTGSSFRDSKGHVTGTLQEFSQQLQEVEPVEFGQLAFNWDEDEHPRDEAGRFKDKLHHQIKEYLSDGSHRHLRDIHDHTGHKDYDALDPLANKANAALKELRDSGQISGTSPSIGEPHFYMTEEQIAKHKTPESVKEKDTDISYKKPVGEEVSSKDELKSKDVGRTRNAIHFDPAIVGPSGATLTSYDWRFEWIVDEEKSDDPIRVSDWNESERNEHTKRQVVHVFHVTDPDGDPHFVSLETAVKLLGLVKKSEDLNKVKSLAQAAIKLAQAKQEHEKLLNDESQKSRYEYKFKVQSSEENIKDLQSKMEFMNSEAAMIGAGKSPVDYYREVARKLQLLIKLYRSDKHGTSQQDRVTEFVKAKGGPSDQQKERRIEGYGHYKKLVAANGMNVLGERKFTTPNVDGEPEKKIFGRTVPAEPAWSDQKMRLWYAKHGKNAEAAIADSHKWLAEHHPDYSILLEHPDFKSLRGEQEFSRLLDITPVEFGRKPAPGQKGFDFDAPATEPIADKAAENEPAKQSSLFADIPAEHLDEAKKLSELHGGREVRKTKSGWQVRSPKGGKVSEVNGTYYPGGQFMPIHGLTEKKAAKPPKAERPKLTESSPQEKKEKTDGEWSGGPRSPMTPDEIEELRKRREEEEMWSDVQRSPLGYLMELGDKPGFKPRTTPNLDKWRDFAERIGPAAISEMKDVFEKTVHESIDESVRAHIARWKESSISSRRPSMDDAEWDKDQIKEAAQQWQGYTPRLYKSHEKNVPGSHYVRELLDRLIEDRDESSGMSYVERMKHYGDMLAKYDGDARSQMVDPVEAKKNGYYPNKFPGTTASGKKVKAGDGWVKRNSQTGKYETYTDDDVKSAIQQFSRDLEICLQEFARHEFSSTQFNIRDAGYPRSQGSPLDALVKLAKSIPTEELHEGERSSRDDMHITVKYGLHTSNSDEVAKIVRGFGPVTVKLGKTSIFPANEKKSYDVVKVAVSGSDIHRLNKLISASTECTDTWPDFKPHLTIAYVMPGFGKKYAGLDTFEGMELTFDSLQFSNKDREKTEISLVDKTEEFSRLPVLTEEEFEFARRPYKPGEGQGEFPFQDRPDQIDSPLGEEPVQSSNMHSFRWEGNDTTGSLLVRFKAKNGGAGPLYRVSVPKSYYEDLKKTAETHASAGKWYWQKIRVKGSVAGHQHPVSLVGTGPTGYVPRSAGLRRGYTGEHFNTRTLNGVQSQLAPAPVRKGPAVRIPGYDPSKLKFTGETTQQPQQTTVQSQTSSGPNPPPASPPKPSPTQPQTTAAQNPNPQTPQSPPNKTKGLIDRVLDFFKKKRKKPDDPKQFSREDWDDMMLVLSSW